MSFHTFHRRVLLDGLYRRLLLRESKPNETVDSSARRLRVAKAWDTVCFRPFEPSEPDFDLVCIVPAASKGWILDAICKEILRYFPGKACITYDHRNLPSSRAYFFAHYMLLKDAALYSPQILRRKLLVWFTHPRDVGMRKDDLTYWLNQTSRVVATCSQFERLLQNDGVLPERLAVVIGGADADFFPGHVRTTDGAVGVCSAFYERKDPDRILHLVRKMPHRKFILLGRNWTQYMHFGELSACPNFEYQEAGYDQYPAFYRRLSVFVSPSRLEGGPIPLLEAMMENVVPVASDTGFARDVISHGTNGYIFPVDAEIDVISGYVDLAFQNTSDIRSSVQDMTWERFSAGIQALL